MRRRLVGAVSKSARSCQTPQDERHIRSGDGFCAATQSLSLFRQSQGRQTWLRESVVIGVSFWVVFVSRFPCILVLLSHRDPIFSFISVVSEEEWIERTPQVRRGTCD